MNKKLEDFTGDNSPELKRKKKIETENLNRNVGK